MREVYGALLSLALLPGSFKEFIAALAPSRGNSSRFVLKKKLHVRIDFS